MGVRLPWTAQEARGLHARYHPEIRSAYVEQFDGTAPVLTIFGEAIYMDESLLANTDQRYQRSRIVWIVVALISRPPAMFEVPEPLWTRKVVQTFLLVLGARLGALVHRRSVVVSTYCIENEHAERLARLPAWIPDRIRTRALTPLLVPFLLLVDRWCFGTDDSRLVYERILGRALTRKLSEKAITILQLPSRCQTCDRVKAAPRVLFVGELSNRKGVEPLLEAWRLLPQALGAELVLVGDGPLRDLVQRRVETLERASWLGSLGRGEIHAQLSRATVLVLLSRPERYWREQVGLPLLEGLAHDCRIVSSSDTGISDWLIDNGHVVVGSDATAAEHVDALVRAIGLGPVASPLDSSNGRAQSIEWMFR